MPRPLPTRWVAIDFETANRERASACALGVAVIEGAAVVDQRAWLIDPASYFEGFNSRLHGIDEDTVAQSPEFDQVWAEFEPMLEDAALLAHNAPFDMSVLRASLARYGLAAPRLSYACSVSIARGTWPRLPNHRLDTVSHHCCVELVHHDPAWDAVACASIVTRACYERGAGDVPELLSGLGITARSL